ncbi:4Fe-4S dicluster domain-containing protein [Thermoproteus tenax]|uniref:Formate dehydrogenase beta subunit n=1 Tax=Thermoproteus tenax (strain ATCC 35583 / DSM 2078 / JCM 9277 / NBRC 100435 / Kra 1) TaxID=768679 RepID=G4RJU7_THETK|nr:4Fe-4S dicluster domain-containing protein [Thermoproteus tenax]CCC81842.1 formate dehydrogenase beta subunit [Thermoproteus tenax Kra 1]
MVSVNFPPADQGYAVLVDIDKCIGCRACQLACKDWNGLSPVKTSFSPTFTNPPDFTAQDWKVVFYYEGTTKKGLATPAGELVFEQVDFAPLPAQCLHCVEAPCARSCPSGAISVTPEGAVVINKEQCIGCGFCQNACPYNVPRRGDDGKYYKCTFCVDRIQNGREPACVEVCPTGVFTFGVASEIIQRAREEQSKGRVVYGLDLDPYVGGQVRWIYVSSDRKSFAIQQHFPSQAVVPTNSIREALKEVAVVGAPVLAVGLAAVGIASWRKSRIEEQERSKSSAQSSGQ